MCAYMHMYTYVLTHTWLPMCLHAYMHTYIQANKRLKVLQSEQSSLGKKINKKVMGMIEKAESEYQELMHKKSVIETDKVRHITSDQIRHIQ